MKYKLIALIYLVVSFFCAFLSVVLGKAYVQGVICDYNNPQFAWTITQVVVYVSVTSFLLVMIAGTLLFPTQAYRAYRKAHFVA